MEDNFSLFIGVLYIVFVTALKIMIICFEGELVADWPFIARTIGDLGKRNEAGSIWWNFIDFVVSQRIPLFVLLQPFILSKVSSSNFLNVSRISGLLVFPHDHNLIIIVFLSCFPHFESKNSWKTKHILSADIIQTVWKIMYTIIFFICYPAIMMRDAQSKNTKIGR
jgi:hypothetical protein